MTDIGQSQKRLEHLYEISKLFASFDTVDQTFDPALGLAAKTLSLRSAILIEQGDDSVKMVVWNSGSQNAGHMRAVKDNVATAFSYLVGPGAANPLDFSELPGSSPLPWQAPIDIMQEHRCVVIPLVVARGPPFGALQIEGVGPLDKADLKFINAIANQLAVALDRDRSWRRAIKQIVEVEAAKQKYEALAEQNARLYREAQQAVRMRDQILAVVSHDLKSPLTTILMTAGVLARKVVPDERRRVLPTSVARIQRSAERMTRLIEDLLDFASVEAGNLAITPKPEDSASLIHETMLAFEVVASEYQLQFMADIASDLPEVHCDRDRILQVLANIVGNATKITPLGGRIDLRVEARAQDVLFSVKDSGPGIGEADVQHLFERYWRSDEARYRGTGLGLAIAQGIVSAHGGRIWVESELGHGATFFFTVPTVDAALRSSVAVGSPHYDSH